MKRFAGPLAQFTAIVGGVTLLALTLLTCVSIIGRALSGVFPSAGFGPITGDYELIEAGIAFAIFCFLPWCQFTAGHATVDVFTNGLSATANRFLLALWEVLTALVAVLILWRLWAGMMGKMNNAETSFLLEFPVWWPYAACLLPAFVFAVVTLWSAWDRLRALTTGQDQRALTSESVH